MCMLRMLGALLSIAALIGLARADEAQVRKAMQAKYPQIAIESIAKTPMPEVYEVYAGGQLIYTDENVNFIIVDGRMIDVKSKADLTAERMQKLTAIKFEDLPLALAFKKVKGNGKHKLAYFADPNCGYCKRFEQEINGLTDATVYMFLYPILSADSVEKSKAVWCSANRAKAWDDWMQKGVAPVAQANCTNPVDKVLEYGRKMNISATPTLIFADGSRVPGAISAERLHQLMEAAPAK